jgi:hypothetical protein
MFNRRLAHFLVEPYTVAVVQYDLDGSSDIFDLHPMGFADVFAIHLQLLGVEENALA